MSDANTYGGVVKDPLDLRDLVYEPGLFELAFALDHRGKVPVILDQGQEGACTGFGLAAVVNFLRHNHRDMNKAERERYRRKENGASPRMLYEMAKRYDEWKGENYEGSSIRGAMKGWSRHGVCRWAEWPYDSSAPGRLTPERQLAALQHPLGAYYRVRHLHLNQMQAALSEAGILYASAQVHEGWQQVDRKTGRIPYSKKLIGGHAFAIVGYDGAGFWVQNSWGPTWGAKGFCHIGYDDWLENAYDCWVARLGVPVVSFTDGKTLVRGRAAEFGFIPDDSVVLETIRPHFVNLGNDGRFSQSGLYSSDERDVSEVVLGGFRQAAENWPVKRLAIYCHGGLNDERASAARIASMRPYFLDNQIYPLHFMWETGFLDSVRGIVEDAFRRGRFQGWTDDLKERFYDLLDEGIELAASPLGKPVWRQMKDNAERASDDGGGATFTIAEAAACLAEMAGKAELHLVGHSAGSIFLAHLLDVISATGTPVKSLTLLAPACTLDLFEAKIAPHLGSLIERFALFNLVASVERDDSVGGAYHKSLLHLVSESFEQRHRAPLLGMEAFVAPAKKALDALREEDRRQSARVKRLLGAPLQDNGKTVIRARALPAALKLDSCSMTHGGFDNDEPTLNSMLRIITGRQKLAREF